MQKFLLYSIILGFFTLTSCQDDTKIKVRKKTTWVDKEKDDHSYANVDEVKTKHLHLELDVNFKNKTIYGVARHDLGKHVSDTIIFDIKHLQIQKITLGKKGSEIESEFVIG
ncbi:MAG: hypothetical protein K9G31_08430, partial [Crocinitomicaceae bacterium]|nr:hypothetical protein [Crocinitomicaceae bacterium]